MTNSPRLSLLKSLIKPQPREMTVPEVHHLIRAHASEASLARYQEAVGRRVAGQAASYVEMHASAYSRTAFPGRVTVEDVTAALSDVAGILRSSTFPQRLIDLCQEEA